MWEAVQSNAKKAESTFELDGRNLPRWDPVM